MGIISLALGGYGLVLALGPGYYLRQIPGYRLFELGWPVGVFFLGMVYLIGGKGLSRGWAWARIMLLVSSGLMVVLELIALLYELAEIQPLIVDSPYNHGLIKLSGYFSFELGSILELVDALVIASALPLVLHALITLLVLISPAAAVPATVSAPGKVDGGAEEASRK
jgi:hypothetical protein